MSFDAANFYEYVEFTVDFVLLITTTLFLKRIVFLENNTARQRKIIGYF